MNFICTIKMVETLVESNHVWFTTDMTNYTVNPEEQLANCTNYERHWKEITSSSEIAALPSVEDATQWVNDYMERSGLHLQVLVCGSLHLVGAVMATLNVTADNLYES